MWVLLLFRYGEPTVQEMTAIEKGSLLQFPREEDIHTTQEHTGKHWSQSGAKRSKGKQKARA